MRNLFVYPLYLILALLALELPAQTTFTEISKSAGIAKLQEVEIGGGCAFVNVNNDSFPDIYLTGNLNDHLFLNNGDGTFVEISDSSGVKNATTFGASTGVISGDIDNDGWQDILVTTSQNSPNRLFHNQGDNTFNEIGIAAGFLDSSNASSSSFGDFDADGLLDVYIVSYIDSGKIILDSMGTPVGYEHVCYENRMYHNNGNLTFSEISNSAGTNDAGCGLATAFTDYDGDADVDIILVNDFGEWVKPNTVFQNQGGTQYPDIGATVGINSEIYGMGIAVGDYDHDHDLDYYITNIGPNELYQNNNGTFTEVAMSAGVRNMYTDTFLTTGWGTAFVDYDLDSWEDLVVTNGKIAMADFVGFTADADSDRVFQNNGDGTFTDVSDTLGFTNINRARGLAAGDIDNDGDIDFLVGMTSVLADSTQHTLLFRNDIQNGNHYLKVSLQGVEANRNGYGARLDIFVNGDSWRKEMDGGSSHHSHHYPVAHFGLGSATTVDSIEVTWPGGRSQKVFSVAADQWIEIVEDTSIVINVDKQNFTAITVFPNPGNTTIKITGARINSVFKLYDLRGRLVRSPKLDRAMTVDIDDLPAGLYIWKVNSVTGKWIKL